MEKDAIEKLFEEFKNHVADNLHLKRVIENSTKYHLEYLNSVDDANWLDNKLINESFLFENLTSGQREKFSYRSSDKQQLIDHVFELHNDQILWLLVNNYEAFESYLDWIYCDLENKVKSPISNNQLSKMLTFFSKTFNEVKAKEKSFVMGLELKTNLTFIEKLRHVVVHNKGITFSEENLFDSAISSSALNNNKKNKIAFMQNFIVENKINMLDWIDSEEERGDVKYKMLEAFSGCLVSYADLIRNQFK